MNVTLRSPNVFSRQNAIIACLSDLNGDLVNSVQFCQGHDTHRDRELSHQKGKDLNESVQKLVY